MEDPFCKSGHICKLNFAHVQQVLLRNNSLCDFIAICFITSKLKTNF